MLYKTTHKWMWPALLLCAWITSSCAMLPVRSEQLPPAAAQGGNAQPEVAIENLRTLVANQLQVAPDAVEVLAAEPVEWPDACLGAAGPDEHCAQAETPGHKITLRVNDELYTYHTDQNANWARLVTAPAADVGEPVMAWTGTVDNGSCQEADIGPGGVAFGYCGGARLGGTFVSSERVKTLDAFADRYRPFATETEAGSLRFAGRGTQDATPDEQLRLAAWAQLVVMEAASGMPFGSLAYYTPAEPGGEDTTQCGSLTIGGGEMTLATCDGNMQTIKLNGGPLNQWLEVQDRLAPFVYEADGTTLVFNGMGAVESEAWQRALLASARTTYDQLSSGQVSAAGSTALAWDLGPTDDMEERCMHLTVLAWGFAQAEVRPCTGGDVLAMQTGWLTTEELEQLDRWLYQHASLTAEQGYVTGQGAEPMGDAEFAAVEQWAAGVWLRLWDVATPQDVVLTSAAADECVVQSLVSPPYISIDVPISNT